MTVVVSVRDIVDAMEFAFDEIHSCLSKETGEIITITDEEITAINRRDDWSDFPDWQQKMLASVDKVLDSSDYLPLPSKFELYEYAIMERFCCSIDDQELSHELSSLIRGSGAFRRFKNAVHHHGIEDEWYQFRDKAFEDIAVEWPESNGIAYSKSDKDKPQRHT
jgi:hypothetical protein